MRLIYVYDFETNGFPLWSKPSSDPEQPHIVQAAAVMVDADTRKVLNSFDLIAKPNDWEIPDDVAKIHGITTEHALAVGVPEMHIVSAVWVFHKVACCRIGHNESFDARIMRIALKRFMEGDEAADQWKTGAANCTQKLATPIVKCPPTAKMLAVGRKHYKSASLGEAYEHFFGKPFEDAHTAMADVLATMAVYWAIIDQGSSESAPDSRIALQEKGGPSGHDHGQGSGGDGVGFL